MIRGWTGWALGTPDRGRQRLARSPRLRVLRLLWETNPRLLIVLGLYILADGFLPIVALVALGRAVGHIPDAVRHGLGSASGHSLLIGLALGTAAYALSLLRSPAEDLLSARRSGWSTWRTPRCWTSWPRRAVSFPRRDRPTPRWRWPVRSATGSAGSSPAWCWPRSAGTSGCCSSSAGRCCGRRCATCWRSGPCWPDGRHQSSGTAGTTWAARIGPRLPRRSESSGWAAGCWRGTATSGWRAWNPSGTRCATSGTGRCSLAS